MTTKTLQIIFLLMAAFAAKADFVGVHGGVGYWDSQMGGVMLAEGIDLEDDLNLAGNSSNHFWFALEHPIPMIPNIRVAQTSMSDSGNGTITQGFDFLGTTYTASQQVQTEIDLTHTDLTLYYELLDIVGTEFDLGVTARWIEADVDIQNFVESVNVVLPMLYVRGKFSLPFSGAYVAANLNYAKYSGNGVTDTVVKIGWETKSFIFPEFGVEVGYRDFDIQLDEGILNFDAGVTGSFINFTAHF